MLPKESNRHKAGRGKSSIGTGLSSTLLSSQRTTTHRKPTAQPGDPLPGHSFNFTRAISYRQIRSAFPQIPPADARLFAVSISVGFGRTAAADLSAARPFPCQLERLYPVGCAAPNRGPHRPVMPSEVVQPRGSPGCSRPAPPISVGIHTARSRSAEVVQPPGAPDHSRPWTCIPGPGRKATWLPRASSNAAAATWVTSGGAGGGPAHREAAVVG